MQSGKLKQVRNFFSLYFIPIIPLNVAGRFVECAVCAGTYDEGILTYDPEKEQRENEIRMLRVMVMAALADDASMILNVPRSTNNMKKSRGCP